MSVINSKYDISYASKDQKCNHCGEKLSFPYVEWHGEEHVFFCSECCAQIKAGLMADLIQVGATHEIRNLQRASYYGDVVLHRTSRHRIEEEGEKERAAIADYSSGRLPPRLPRK